MPVGLFINYCMNICLHIGVEENASLRPEISLHVLISVTDCQRGLSDMYEGESKNEDNF